MQCASTFVGRAGRGAGGGNRTLTASLEGWSSTVELHPPAADHRLAHLATGGGGGRIQTYVDVRRQIYSLLPLTARPPLRARLSETRAEYGRSASLVNNTAGKRQHLVPPSKIAVANPRGTLVDTPPAANRARRPGAVLAVRPARRGRRPGHPGPPLLPRAGDGVGPARD